MESANSRIAKNTIYMYIRLFLTMFIGLYSSRIVLQVLGVSDYGLFAVVGGVLAMFTFISSSLGTATSRFLNAEMGKQDGDVNRIFNVNVVLHTILAVIILLFAETIGLWYVCNKLTIAPGKLSDAIFIYQVAIITACAGIINSPYASLFTAHERFRFLTQFDILNSLIRFCCIFLLQFYHGDNVLRLYAMIVCLTTANTFIVYHWLAARDWPRIIKFRLIRGWNYYKDVLVFGNWNLLATASYMARNSGSDLILNAFYGTTMNGAFAISKNVNQYVAEFSARFDSASAPQIIQSYAAGDKERYTYLAFKLGRFSILLFELVFFPLFIELEFILHLWLGDVPDGALVLTQINLILAGVSLTIGGAYQVINASGKIKWFKIVLSFFFLSCIPISFFLFKCGYPAYTMLVIFLIADIFQRVIQLILLNKVIGFDSLKYVREAYVRPFIIAMIMTLVLLYYKTLTVELVWMKLTFIGLTFFLCAVLIAMIGLKKNERRTLLGKVRAKLSHK